MVKNFILVAMCALGVCVATSCGGNQKQASTEAGAGNEAVQETVAEEAPAQSASYDIERIKSIKQPTEADNDFLLDQYELVCKETKGMDGNEKKAYLMKKGDEGKVLALLIMGVENSKNLTDAQKERRAAIQEKYK